MQQLDALQHELVKDLIKAIDTRYTRRVELVVDGNSDDYADYKHHVGYVRALKDVKEDLNALLKQYYTL